MGLVRLAFWLRVGLLALLACFVPGCAAFRALLVEEGASAAVDAVGVVLRRGDVAARRNFDTKWRPITGKGFSDYDLNSDGSLDQEEAFEASADLAVVTAEKAAEGTPLDKKELAGAAGALLTVAATGYAAHKNGLSSLKNEILARARSTGSRLGGGDQPPTAPPSGPAEVDVKV